MLRDRIFLLVLDTLLHFLVSHVVELKDVLVMLVLFDSRLSGRAKHLLRIRVLFKLKDKLIHLLSASSDVSLCKIHPSLQFMQLLPQHRDLLVFVLDLVLLHCEQALHVLELILLRYDGITAALVFF